MPYLIVGKYTFGWTMGERVGADRPKRLEPTRGFEFGLQIIIAGL
jgi:hypothetical protein